MSDTAPERAVRRAAKKAGLRVGKVKEDSQFFAEWGTYTLTDATGEMCARGIGTVEELLIALAWAAERPKKATS